MSSERLEKDFEKELLNLCKRAEDEVKFKSSRILQMISEKGGVETAKALINSPVTSGFAALLSKGRPDLTVESFVATNSRWHPLFSDDELTKVKKIITSP